MIDWPQIFFGAAMSAAVAAVVVRVARREQTTVVALCAFAAFIGPLAWNAILHRAATDADGFFVDIPFKPFPVSWQDTGSGVFTLAVASAVLGLRQPHRPAATVLALSLATAIMAFLVDIYLY